MTIDNPTRVPRKVKKKIVKEFGNEVFQCLLCGDIVYKARMETFFDSGWRYKYIGHTIFVTIR
jgi:hypothetical protein